MPKNWKPVTLKPLTGQFDARSVPSDITIGSFRWRQNWEVSDEGKLLRRSGFQRFFSELKYDTDDYPCWLPRPDTSLPCSTKNHDHSNQAEDQDAGEVREPINLLFESTSKSGARTLFDATQSRISVMDEDEGTWADIATGKGTDGSRFQAAELNNKVVFTNNVNPVLIHTLGTTTTAEIDELKNGLNVLAAKIVIKFGGFIVLMNVYQDSERKSSRVRWCGVNAPTTWVSVPTGSTANLAGYYDLDYGDDILGAEQLGGQILIYTKSSIWSMSATGGATEFNKVFTFNRIYTEPRNQKGCLVYPNTLVSTGKDHYYMGKDGVYKYNRYTRNPERVDWIHKASAIIYDSARYSTGLDASDCELPVGHYISDSEEVLFSWSTNAPDKTNNVSLSCNTKWETCDYIDAGFNAFTYYTPVADCNTAGARLVGSSGRDWALKEIGGVDYREYILLESLTVSDENPTYSRQGYKSMLRGRVPTGSDNKMVKLRRVEVEHESTMNTEFPAFIRLRLGQQNIFADPNVVSGKCAVVWRRHKDELLSCKDRYTAEQYEALNLKPDEGTYWTVYEDGRHLYFEFSIEGVGGGDPIYCTSAWNDIKFSVNAGKPQLSMA